MRAVQDQINGTLKTLTDRTAMNALLQLSAIDARSAALAALAAKGATADAAAYRTLPTTIADKVAKASPEGGFLGFGGERVSDGERLFLAQLNALVGSKLA